MREHGNEERHDACTNLGANVLRGREQVRGQPRLARRRRTTAKAAERIKLHHTVIDPARNSQGLPEERLCSRPRLQMSSRASWLWVTSPSWESSAGLQYRPPG